MNNYYIYNLKTTLITKSESVFFEAIKKSIPENYNVFPQINLATFIERTDGSRFHNELFRNIDFLITDEAYQPKIIIEINDQSHFTQERKLRDEKVKYICEEAGIPIIKLWTTYGVNTEYISKRIYETLQSLPIQRISHQSIEYEKPYYTAENYTTYRNGCYIATCVYGSYDCPEVWTLRRYRDYKLKNTWYGRLFIKIYYSISPKLVKIFGNKNWFRKIFKNKIDKMVKKLYNQGYKNTPYYDL